MVQSDTFAAAHGLHVAHVISPIILRNNYCSE